MRLGYARVSTGDQSLDGQCQRLSAAGCDKLFEEKISGATRNRPQLEKLIEHLRKDDILVVTRLDRLARSTSDLLRIAERLTEKVQDYNRLTSRGPTRQARPAVWS